ncbi:VOC family protein [Lapillicoccus jejuensis]|uniref:Glyoxalase-like domain-containing protein n=1 Tax=Lapillicoccus jejuensis TaxID=402171 RepID=A0A542E5M5_9MICO|nr:VOC family protein [Lapillicoccus jejuensis]TQJ10633.1 hypothetical protein FB458_3762 [Lapillicoccus jejuensis]
MRLENVVLDAHDPSVLGAFWAGLLGAEPLFASPDLVEARMPLADGVFLDLCLVRVPDPWTGPRRLHLDLAGGARQAAVVARAEALGARRVDIGQRDAPWVVLADVEGNPFCVMEERPAYDAAAAPIAALPLDSADPVRDAAFWATASGWVVQPADGDGRVLRHPLGVGPLLELCPEPSPKAADGKNRVHLDVRPTDGDDRDEVLARLLDLGGRPAPGTADDLPWTVLQDPSGNEVCLLAHEVADQQ